MLREYNCNKACPTGWIPSPEDSQDAVRTGGWSWYEHRSQPYTVAFVFIDVFTQLLLKLPVTPNIWLQLLRFEANGYSYISCKYSRVISYFYCVISCDGRKGDWYHIDLHLYQRLYTTVYVLHNSCKTTDTSTNIAVKTELYTNVGIFPPLNLSTDSSVAT